MDVEFADTCSPANTPPLCQTRLEPSPSSPPPRLAAVRPSSQQSTTAQPAISLQVQQRLFLFRFAHFTPPEVYLAVSIDFFTAPKPQTATALNLLALKVCLISCQNHVKVLSFVRSLQIKKKPITQTSNSQRNRVSP